MTNELNPKAWNVLSKDEQTAITLSLALNKSTWEAGGIMKKSHFKFLEIKDRAEHFIQIFQNYFEIYPDFFSSDQRVSLGFKEFIQGTILERKKVGEISKLIYDSRYQKASLRETLLIEEITKLKRSSRQSELDLCNLILEFDKWNNFRILPAQIQEPSAFKRRNKVRDLRYLKNCIVPDITLEYLYNKYNYKGKYKTIYFGLIFYNLDDYKVISAKDTQALREEILKLGVFLFETEEQCEDFTTLAYNYLSASKRHCKTGQSFWPKFRERVIKAVNYNEVYSVKVNQGFGIRLNGVNLVNSSN